MKVNEEAPVDLLHSVISSSKSSDINWSEAVSKRYMYVPTLCIIFQA